MPEDPLLRAKELTEAKNWRKIAFQQGFRAQDTILVRFCSIPDDKERRNVETWLATVLSYDDPYADQIKYDGKWRVVDRVVGTWKDADTGRAPQTGIVETLHFGYRATLLNQQDKVDFSEARLVRPGEINQLAEAFTVQFVNLDPTKVNAMLSELRTKVPYESPTIQGNQLEGNFLHNRIRGWQAEDGSGVIFLAASKGGRNLGNIDLGPTADRVTVHTAGNISYTEYAYFWRQTFTEIQALKTKLAALGNTAGVHVRHELHETDEGGPYNLFVEILVLGSQAATSTEEDGKRTLTITRTKDAAEAATAPAWAAGKKVGARNQPNGNGTFDTETSLEQGKVLSAGPVEIFNDGLVSHKVSYVLNAAAVPDTNHDGEETDTTAHASDPRRVLYLRPEYNDYGLWNFLKLEIRLLGYDLTAAPYNSGTTYAAGAMVKNAGGTITYESQQAGNTNHALTDGAWWLPVAKLVVNNQQEKKTQVDLRTVPKVSFTPVPAEIGMGGYWKLESEFPCVLWALKRLDTLVGTTYFYLSAVNALAATGDGFDVRNGFDGERMVWLKSVGLTTYDTWHHDQDEQITNT